MQIVKFFTYNSDDFLHCVKISAFSSAIPSSDKQEIGITSKFGYLRLNVPSLMVSRKIAMVEAIKLYQAGIPEEKILGLLNKKLIPFWSAAKFAISKLKERIALRNQTTAMQ